MLILNVWRHVRREFARRAAAISSLALFAIGSSAAVTPETHADLLFAAPFLSFDSGIYPYSVAIGDLNGDGRADLAVANYGASTVSVLLGNGDGTFGPKSDYGKNSQAGEAEPPSGWRPRLRAPIRMSHSSRTAKSQQIRMHARVRNA